MKRREFMLLMSSAMGAARALRAQQKAMPVVGWLQSFSPPANLGAVGRGPVHQGLREAGFVEG